MNYYKQVAEMLGVELGEEFKVSITEAFVYKITENGLRRRCQTASEWAGGSPVTLTSLLKGDYSIVKLPWKPKEEEEYWHYSEAWNEGISCKWEGGWFDLLLWKVGYCFKTKNEADIKGKEIIKQIRKEYEEA